MNELIENVLTWGRDKGIIGSSGRGTPKAQANKMLEECNETRDAVLKASAEKYQNPQTVEEIKDGIGDTVVTLILLADLYDWTLKDCLQHAYDIISKRKGEMVDGTFVKASDEKIAQENGLAPYA